MKKLKNSEIFLSYFNKIQRFLREKTNLSKEDSFLKLVEKANKLKNIGFTISYYKNDLKELADLRNCIVHEYEDGMVLAEPNKMALDLIEKIYNGIIKPPSIRTIAQKKVEVTKASDSLDKIVRVMHENNYSQIPVYDNENFIGLLTENGIMHWLGEKAKDDIFSLEEMKVKEVLKHEENPKNYVFFNRNQTIYDAIEVFSRNLKNPKRKIQAILITENGKPSEKLLGIVTVWDIALILQKIKIKIK